MELSAMLKIIEAFADVHQGTTATLKFPAKQLKYQEPAVDQTLNVLTLNRASMKNASAHVIVDKMQIATFQTTTQCALVNLASLETHNLVVSSLNVKAIQSVLTTKLALMLIALVHAP
jgi:hypothetical protein